MVIVKKEMMNTDFVNMEIDAHETNGCHQDGV